MKKSTLTFWTLVLCSFALIAQDRLIIEKVITNGFDENGNEKWRLAADKTKGSKKNVSLFGVTITLFKDDKTIIRTPECQLNNKKKSIHSEQNLEAKSSTFKLTGTGFDIDTENDIIFIRSNAKVKWKKIKKKAQ